MVFVDTNYFLRYLVQDNPKQQRIVEDLLLNAAKGKIELCTSSLVIFEIYWVLNSFYQLEKEDIITLLYRILHLKFINLPSRTRLIKSLELYQQNSFSLEDAHHLIYAKSKKAEHFATFDQKLKKTFNQLLDN
jgi:predicted nucleic acid-binding protein